MNHLVEIWADDYIRVVKGINTKNNLIDINIHFLQGCIDSTA